MAGCCDYTPDLDNQNVFMRALCWPVQSCVALSNACLTCDCDGALKVLLCCPCRTLCGWCETDAEQVAETKQE